ncbi:lipid A deacylase LpxR family protein [Nitrospina sp. 32_T5]|uniref:lipid A deacylase LpxR family protein n=1 Tax=unclassified Nitrospina TaxID=2638683 RepID=UPI003F96D364
MKRKRGEEPLKGKKGVAGRLFAAGFLLSTCLGGVTPAPAAAQPGMDCPEYFFNATDANDFFAGLTDRHFTQGLRMSFVERGTGTDDPGWAERVRQNCASSHLPGRAGMGVLRFLTNSTRKAGQATLGNWFDFKTDTVSVILGHNIYTPEDLSKTGLVSRDRPYAGWLYVGFGFFDEKKDREVLGLTVDTLDSVEIDLGVIGPASGGERVQREWHAFIDDEDPKGWDNQLHNEFALLISYDRKYRHRLLEENGMIPGVDWIPGGGVALGNVFTYVAAGGVVRVGYNLPADYGPPRIRPGTQGSDFFDTGGRHKNKLMAYLYTGVEGRAVAHNIFLDGNTFRTSHAVNKRYLVGDWQFGGALAYDCIRLAYTQVYRSQEFKGQFEPDVFGTVTLSVRF